MSSEITTRHAVIAVNERTNGRYDAILHDEDGEPIQAAQVSSIRLTLIEVQSGEVVNERNNQNVLNANGGTLDAETGEFTWSWTPADTAIVSHTGVGHREVHKATISVVWDNESKQQHRVIRLLVLNLQSVPQGAQE